MTLSQAKNLCGGTATTTHDYFTNKGRYLNVKAKALSTMMNNHISYDDKSLLNRLLGIGDTVFNCN